MSTKWFCYQFVSDFLSSSPCWDLLRMSLEPSLVLPLLTPIKSMLLSTTQAGDLRNLPAAHLSLWLSAPHIHLLTGCFYLHVPLQEPTLHLHDLESECLIRFCTLGTSLPHPTPSPAFKLLKFNRNTI